MYVLGPIPDKVLDINSKTVKISHKDSFHAQESPLCKELCGSKCQ
jgi:hypothetical protein